MPVIAALCRSRNLKLSDSSVNWKPNRHHFYDGSVSSQCPSHVFKWKHICQSQFDLSVKHLHRSLHVFFFMTPGECPIITGEWPWWSYHSCQAQWWPCFLLRHLSCYTHQWQDIIWRIWSYYSRHGTGITDQKAEAIFLLFVYCFWFECQSDNVGRYSGILLFLKSVVELPVGLLQWLWMFCSF